MAEKRVIDERCEFCLSPLPRDLLPHKGQELTDTELNHLWKIFVAISQMWEIDGVIRLKSSWLEFMEAKTTTEPNYTAEYSNAVLVVAELIKDYGEDEAFVMLFLHHGVPDGPPETCLAHAKRFVVDEFIRVQIVSSGFKSFVSEEDRRQVNYRGYVGGSRYNRVARIREYKPENKES